MHAKSPLLLLAFTLLAILCHHQIIADDAAAMHDLASSIPSASAALNWSSSSSSDPCAWSHVQCSGGVRVTAIQIGNMGLPGSLPASLKGLTELTRLEIMNNRITGSLPDISSLTKLQYLFLHNNSFTSIPRDFFAGLNSLVHVSIGDNPLHNWVIGEGLKSALNLVNFDASDCGVQGEIPDFFGTSFPSLELLKLSYNNLTGEVPQSFASSSIKFLILNSQKGGKLTGGIDVISNVTSLKQLWLHSNSFSGALPDFSGLFNLEDLDLRDNKFTGPVPDSLTKLSSLKNVVLSNNLLQGRVPVFNPGVKLDLDPTSERFCRTDKSDCDPTVNLLLAIARSFGYPMIFADNWRGNNACGGGWLGIACDTAGNVVGINFGRFGLSGTISPDFGSLPSLQKLVLSNNCLTGIIPETLANLKDLRVLDLSYNSLHGEIPPFAQNVSVITTGNPDIGDVEPENADVTKKRSSKYVALIVIFSLGAILVLLALVLYYCKKFHVGQYNNNTVSGAKKNNVSVVPSVSPNAVLSGDDNNNASKRGPKIINDGPILCEPASLVIPIRILRHVTNDFSEANILGRGGFGTVYRGELHDGTKMAVKRMQNGAINSDGLSEFKSEISVLTKVRHRNLVALLGYFLDANEKILVYEYMSQGTLTDHLFDWERRGFEPLSWKRRLCVGLDVARGVEYLHRLARQSFIHRDLKPSNVLLGDDMRAKVSDFGLVKRAPDGQFSVETRLAGTFGYLAPEYAATGRVTTKADVYSFGVILMELITGRRALERSQSGDSTFHLVTWFWRIYLTSKSEFRSAIDPLINDQDHETFASVSTIAELASYCCTREPHQRPDMGHVVNVLSSQAEAWKPSDGYDDGVEFDLTLLEALRQWQELDASLSSDASQLSGLSSGR